MNKRENIVNYREIGEVRYVKNRRARHISIRINAQGEVRVTVPGRLSLSRAEAYVMRRKTWIHAKLGEINKVSERFRLPEAGEVVVIRGKKVQLTLRAREETGEEALWRILLREASAYLPERVRFLSESHGLPYSGLKIRRMKSRWGSCTARNSINLNSWLMMLPEHLSDYIILHELVHTLHPNHSTAFWETLDRFTHGRSNELRQELKSCRIMSLPACNADSGIIPAPGN